MGLVLDKDSWIQRLMAITPVEEVWGIGRQHTIKLHGLGITTVAQFAAMPHSLVRQQFNMVMERTNLELNGIVCLGLEQTIAKQEIVSSRSFSKKITELEDLSQAVLGHVANAAVKLRKQRSVCKILVVFAKTSAFNPDEPYQSIRGQYHFIVSPRPYPIEVVSRYVVAAHQCLYPYVSADVLAHPPNTHTGQDHSI